MTYVDQWKALSSRILGLAEAGKLHACLPRNAYGPTKSLGTHLSRVISTIESFKATFAASLPPSVLGSIDSLFTSGIVIDPNTNGDARDEQVWAALVKLRGFESEVSFLLTDSQQIMRSQTERALEHLQRSIIADPEFQQKWIAAFTKGELACEALGSIHLLQHGIWAFKANAEGGKTDLVYQEPIVETSLMERTSAGLVLTEWKKSTGDSAATSFAEARAQAEIYSKGILAGIELASYRYAIVVSEKQLQIPADSTIDGITYRHINIAVQGRLPSRQSPINARANPNA